MKRLARTARAALANPGAKTTVRARFADALGLPSCYPEASRAIHLH